MNKEARYIVRLAHTGAHPSDHAALLARVREIVQPLRGRAINLRVSRRAIEFDLYCPPERELHPFLDALEPMGAVLTYKRLDLPPGPVIPGEVMAEARRLFNEERYWEVHEILEGLWKKSEGREKQLLQGLILTAAALVHVQKDEMPVVEAMLDESLRRLENQPAAYLGLDVQQFLRHVKKIRTSKTFDFPSI